MSNIVDLSDLKEVTFSFPEGDKFIEDPQRNQIVKNMLYPKTNQPKLPVDYQIDMQVVLKDLVAQDLLGDQGVMKYIFKEGVENDPQVHHKGIVKVKYELRLADGRLKDPVKTRNNVNRISLNSSHAIIKGLGVAFNSMKTGEIAWYGISGAYNYADQQPIMEEQILYYKIEMVEHTDPKVIINNSCQEERLKNLEDIRESGVELFKKCNYDQAIREYQRGINYASTWPKSLQNSSVMMQVKTMKLIFQSNLAQCLINVAKFDTALNILDKIKSEARNTSIEVKTLYRLAKCYSKQSQYEEALQTIKDLISLCTLNHDEQADVELLQRQCRMKIDDEMLKMQRKMKRVKK